MFLTFVLSTVIFEKDATLLHSFKFLFFLDFEIAMPFDIFNLPLQTIDRICGFVDDETLLRMREVRMVRNTALRMSLNRDNCKFMHLTLFQTCKKFKEFAEFTFFNTRKAEINVITICPCSIVSSKIETHKISFYGMGSCLSKSLRFCIQKIAGQQAEQFISFLGDVSNF